MRFTERRRVQPELNLTPLIDIVFLLLIFFMVSANFIDENSTEIMLPKSTLEASEIPTQDIVVSIDKNGRYFIGEEQVEKENLDSRLKERIMKNLEKSVIVAGDANSRLQEILFLMESAKKAGAKSLSIKSEVE